MELEKFEDERGFFAHGWSPRELAAHGLEAPLAESAISFNKKRGIVRGMHYQASPHGQIKIVRCTRGAIYDVIIDLRTESPSSGAHIRRSSTLPIPGENQTSEVIRYRAVAHAWK